MYSETDYLDERSILNQMTKYDNLIQKFYDILRRYQSATSEITGYMEEIDDNIKNEFDKIEEEMINRLKSICKMMCSSKDSSLTDTIKYKNEVYLLTKDNNELLEEIRKLKEKIKNMELRIGKDSPDKLMNYTK